MKTLISQYPLVTYVLVLAHTKDCWVDMRRDLFQLTDCYYEYPGDYRIEKWVYYRYDTGDKLVSQKVMEEYDGQ